MNEYELAVQDCSEAIKCNPMYVKVIWRRCQAYEVLDKLEEALADANRILELDELFPTAQDTVLRLTRLIEERNNKLKDEALGKLKELGNTILGNFGISLDNFKMVQDPSTGSWNISMINQK